MKKNHILTTTLALVLILVYTAPIAGVPLEIRLVTAIGISFVAGLIVGRVAAALAIVILILLAVIAETTIKHPPSVHIMWIAVVTLTVLQGLAVFVGEWLRKIARGRKS